MYESIYSSSSYFLHDPALEGALNNKETYPDSKMRARLDKLYVKNKRGAFIYQMIFLAFSMLFLSLGLVVILQSTNHACFDFFGHCTLIKVGISALCFILSLCALGIGVSICPERIAAQKTYQTVLDLVPGRREKTLHVLEWLIKVSRKESERLALEKGRYTTRA